MEEYLGCKSFKSSQVISLESMSQFIPTKVNLFRRRVVEDKSCHCCKREDETIIHAIWTCQGAQDVWGCGSVQFQKCSTQVQDFTTLLVQLMQKLVMEHLCLMATVTRRIWLRRNLLVF
jgi:hypothetical protein